MSWTEIGVLSDVLGALAVVISLVYLSRQVRQNTRAVRSGNASKVQSNFQQLARVFYTDREMGDIIIRVLAGKTEMRPADLFAAKAYFFDLLKSAEVEYYQFLNGELDQKLWEASLNFYRTYFNTPGIKAYWKERHPAFMPEFRKAMETWLSSPSPIKKPYSLVGIEEIESA